MEKRPTLLAILPRAWSGLWQTRLADGQSVTLIRHGEAPYDPAAIDYVLSFRPPAGLLQSLPHLKAAFSMGAGVDGFFAHGDYPAKVPLVRFADITLTAEMAQYVLMYALIHHRDLRKYDALQTRGAWRQEMLARPTAQTRIGILGQGEIGGFCAARFAELGFPVAGWSRTKKMLPGIASYAGDGELSAFFASSDILICLLPLTPETKGILNARAFAAMPQGGFVINVARGAHVVNEDLIAALDAGQLSGAVLDVFESEPLAPDDPLWRHPKITITPHIASISQAPVAAEYVLAGIKAFECGETPPNTVDVGRGY
jgi:glyoxylate/hydroxypyruvate reductase